MLRFRADPATRYYEAVFDPEITILLCCASGARAAPAGSTLREMGFEHVCNLGDFADLVAEGFAVEHRP
jgi:rhodanese-related sulfurtransferase